ncbi:MAG: hypothetical protein ACXACY_14250 [Candidatus Hodarchaeales archaeon]|jgi:hypothetical protein
MSPKEYSYINKTQINKSTYSVKEQKNEKKVHTDLKNSVFKTRLYEIYDNMNGVRSIEDIVEEGAYKTIKEIMVNRIVEISNRIVEISEKNPKIDIDIIASTVKTDFPYNDIPPEPQKARSFFVTTLCDMVADSMYLRAENN